MTLNILFYKYETVPALKEFTVYRKDINYHMQLCSKPIRNSVIFKERSWVEVTRKAPRQHIRGSTFGAGQCSMNRIEGEHPSQKEQCKERQRKETADVKAATIRQYCIFMSESAVNSQIYLNNSLIKKNLTIMNEFLFFSLIKNTNSLCFTRISNQCYLIGEKKT